MQSFLIDGGRAGERRKLDKRIKSNTVGVAPTVEGGASGEKIRRWGSLL